MVIVLSALVVQVNCACNAAGASNNNNKGRSLDRHDFQFT